ncbi:hypothetical protein HN587_06495 [Candidatus Woesearchaeota archaeon]|nr:hypothetical protein [Candidatus Woesearchaeota archaeon]
MVIIILVIVGMLFAIKFVLLKPQAETKKNYMTTQMVSNFAVAIMHSTTQDCRGTDMSELMIDCANWKESSGSIVCENGEKSCEYVKDVFETVINETLAVWKMPYYIKAGTSKLDQEQIFIFQSSPLCHDKVPGESEQFFLPTDRGLLSFKVFICR